MMAEPSSAEVVRIARQAFNSGRTRPGEWRKQQLRNLLRMMEENEELLCEALYNDLRKPKQVKFETEPNALMS